MINDETYSNVELQEFISFINSVETKLQARTSLRITDINNAIEYTGGDMLSVLVPCEVNIQSTMQILSEALMEIGYSGVFSDCVTLDNNRVQIHVNLLSGIQCEFVVSDFNVYLAIPNDLRGLLERNVGWKFPNS